MSSRTLPLLVLVTAALLLPSSAFAQCVDPPTPSGGFAVTEVFNLPSIRSDGYVALSDVRFPTVAPGPCGWPLVVVVHGSGGDKGVVAGIALGLAAQGYITCAYDVRGQGPSMALNPVALAHDFTGLRELIDLFETMEWTAANFPARTDASRIGVTGYSQGGQHSWWGAMHSGRIPPANPWRAAPFPVVKAVVVRAAGAGDLSSTASPFGDETASKLFAPGGGVTYRPSALAIFQPLLLAEDFAGFEAARNVPGMNPSLLLPLCNVPVMAHASYDDRRVNPSGVYGSILQLPAATPKKLQLGTGGHDSPANDQDDGIYARNRRDWFDRFLKSIPNGIDLEPRVRAAVTPDDVAVYQNPASLWDFRIQDTLPTPATVSQTLYLAPGGNLVPGAPAGGGGVAGNVAHAVPAGFGIGNYVALQPNAAQLALIIPPSNLDFDSAPLAGDRTLQGIGSLTLNTSSATPNYQLHAVLYDVAPNGSARFVTSGAVATRGTAGLVTLTANFYLQSYTFRAGHSLRLRLENLFIHRPPTGAGAEIKWIPFFDAANINVLVGGPTPSALTLPFLPLPGPRLTAFPAAQSVAAPINQRYTVHTDSAHAGTPTLLVPSFAGTSPGTAVGPLIVPLNFDALSFAILANPALPPFVNFLSNLDAVGSTSAGIAIGGIPLPAAFVGLELSVVGGVVGPTLEVTNPVTIGFVN